MTCRMGATPPMTYRNRPKSVLARIQSSLSSLQPQSVTVAVTIAHCQALTVVHLYFTTQKEDRDELRDASGVFSIF
jgi:hypothetical protein